MAAVADMDDSVDAPSPDPEVTVNEQLALIQERQDLELAAMKQRHHQELEAVLARRKHDSSKVTAKSRAVKPATRKTCEAGLLTSLCEPSSSIKHGKNKDPRPVILPASSMMLPSTPNPNQTIDTHNDQGPIKDEPNAETACDLARPHAKSQVIIDLTNDSDYCSDKEDTSAISNPTNFNGWTMHSVTTYDISHYGPLISMRLDRAASGFHVRYYEMRTKSYILLHTINPPRTMNWVRDDMNGRIKLIGGSTELRSWWVSLHFARLEDYNAFLACLPTPTRVHDLSSIEMDRVFDKPPSPSFNDKEDAENVRGLLCQFQKTHQSPSTLVTSHNSIAENQILTLKEAESLNSTTTTQTSQEATLASGEVVPTNGGVLPAKVASQDLSTCYEFSSTTCTRAVEPGMLSHDVPGWWAETWKRRTVQLEKEKEKDDHSKVNKLATTITTAPSISNGPSPLISPQKLASKDSKALLLNSQRFTTPASSTHQTSRESGTSRVPAQQHRTNASSVSCPTSRFTTPAPTTTTATSVTTSSPKTPSSKRQLTVNLSDGDTDSESERICNQTSSRKRKDVEPPTPKKARHGYSAQNEMASPSRRKASTSSPSTKFAPLTPLPKPPMRNRMPNHHDTPISTTFSPSGRPRRRAFEETVRNIKKCAADEARFWAEHGAAELTPERLATEMDERMSMEPADLGNEVATSSWAMRFSKGDRILAKKLGRNDDDDYEDGETVLEELCMEG